MTGTLISRGEKPHYCDPPYGRRLRRLKRSGPVHPGAVWQCDFCDALYEWRGGYDGYAWHLRLRPRTSPVMPA